MTTDVSLICTSHFIVFLYMSIVFIHSFKCFCNLQDVVLKALGAEIVRVPAAPFGTAGKCELHV